MPIGAMPTAGRQVFRILGRLRDELKVNSTCGASQRQLRAAAPRGHQRRLPRDGDGERPDLGDHEPDRRRASATRVMAADVLLGNDRDARPLDPDPPRRAARRRGRRPARRTGREREPARRRPADDDAEPPRREPLVIFTPSGRRGRFATGTTVLDAARALGVDIDSVCGGRGICGRCQVEQSVGSFAEARDRVDAPDHLSPLGPVEADYREQEGPRRGPSAQLHRARPRRRRHRRPAREPGLPPGRPQGPRRARASSIDPVVRLHYVEVDAARARLADRRPRAGSRRRSSANGALTDLRGRPRRHPRAPAGAREGRLRGHGRGPRRGATIIAVWPGFHDRALRRRDRRRLDDDRRPPRRTSPTARSSPATA